MKQKSIVLLLLICLISALVLPAAATEVPAVETPVTDFTPLDTTAPAEVFTGVPGSALLIELNSGVTLFAHNAAERRYPASLTKIMTALLALEHGNLDDQITVSETALENLHEDGSTVGLQAGEIISLKDLLYCIMVASANEACNVIAEYISGSVDAFVALMNEKAAELGCTGTHFANAHGLHDENHYTTAQDLALIVQAAMAYPEFRETSNTPQYTVPATNMSEERKLYSTNKLISTTTDTSGGNYYYSKAAGIKTGFTTPAQRCLISTATNDNLQFLGVILYAENAYNEETGSYDFRSFPEFINMCEYFFERYQYTTVLTTLYPVAEMPVNQSAGAQTVALAPVAEIRSLVSQDFDPETVQLNVQLDYESVDAPGEAGTVLGSVTVLLGNKEVGTVDLAAITSVVRSEVTHRAEATREYVEDNWWKWLVGILLLIVALIVLCFFLLQLYRRRERKRKVAARRRALEMRERQERLREYSPPDWDDSWKE